MTRAGRKRRAGLQVSRGPRSGPRVGGPVRLSGPGEGARCAGPGEGPAPLGGPGLGVAPGAGRGLDAGGFATSPEAFGGRGGEVGRALRALVLVFFSPELFRNAGDLIEPVSPKAGQSSVLACGSEAACCPDALGGWGRRVPSRSPAGTIQRFGKSLTHDFLFLIF